jgi:Uma2 family endonuclease
MQTVSAAEISRHRWTRSEYALLYDSEIRCELIDGEIYDMSPTKPRRAAVTNRLARLLNGMLDEATFTVGSQTPVVLSDISEPEPDVWIAHLSFRAFIARKPEPVDLSLVVEIADTSLRLDRDVKLSMYARAGVATAWLVDLNANTVTVCTSPVDGAYRSVETVGADGEVTLPWGVAMAVSDVLLLDV